MSLTALQIFTRAITIGNPDIKLTVTPPKGDAGGEILFDCSFGGRAPIFVTPYANREETFVLQQEVIHPDGSRTRDRAVEGTVYSLDNLDVLVKAVLDLMRGFNVDSAADAIDLAVENTMLDYQQELALTFIKHHARIAELAEIIDEDDGENELMAELYVAEDDVAVELAEKARNAVSEEDGDDAYQVFDDQFPDFTRDLGTDMRVLMFVNKNGLDEAEDLFDL